MRFNRIFVMSAVVILLVLATTILPTPALAAPSFSISPTSGTAGTLVTINGINFTSYTNDQVSIYFGNTEVKGSPVTVPGNGAFTLTFPVPDNAMPGTSLIMVKDKRGTQLSDSVPFDVPKPSITLDKGGGVIGTTVKITGKGFYASQMVTFAYSDHVTAELGKIAATPTGECSYVFTVPESTGKKNKVVATDAAGNTAEAVFSVIPSIILEPTEGAIGNPVKVTGKGFGYQSQVTITFGEKEVARHGVQTNGDFEATFKVPDMSLQSYDIEISDTEGNTTTATFTINAGKPSFVFPQWGTYTLMGVGGLVLFFLGLWLGRKFAYTY